MTTPDRTVEEIVEEFKYIFALEHSAKGYRFPHNEPDNQMSDAEAISWIYNNLFKLESLVLETLQAERQKREEIVEAEREKFLIVLSKLRECDGDDRLKMVNEFIRNIKITQPNNPK